MRNISAASLAEMAKHYGTEPQNIIEVQWAKDGPRTMYGDNKSEGVDGRLLSLDGLEDVINVSYSGTNQSVSITLDDHDGHLKAIFNNTDIHKKKVWIYQWYRGLPLDQRFLIFNGVIVSPVSWKEGDRTLSFTVTTQTEDKEIGFSAEDGAFPNLPQTLVGKVWPLIFGTCFKIPCVLVDDIKGRPNKDDDKDDQGDNAGVATAEDAGIEDPSLGPKISELDKNRGNLMKLARIYFIGYLQASHTARKRGELGDLDDIDKGKGKFSSLAKQYLNLGNKALLDAQKVEKKSAKLKIIRQKQKTFEKPNIKITDGTAFTQGQTLNLNLGGAIHTGYVIGDSFHVVSRTHPQIELYKAFEDTTATSDQIGPPTLPRDKFFYIPSGYPLKISLTPESTDDDDRPDDFYAPTRYLVSGSIHVSVQAVFAYRTVNGIRRLSVVPFNYFVTYNVMYGTMPATMVIMQMPLSARENRNGDSEGWEDEIWANVVSPVGPNTVDILRWLITNYTTASIDEASFASVRADINLYPSNFAMFDRPNVFSALADIAYQARCMIWLKNDVFYLKYLAKKDTPVAVITEADIEENSMEVNYTETEDVHTKIVAEWFATYRQTRPNLIICRYNTDYYGVQESRKSWFIYTQQQLVQKSATFWLIREANTYKRITFKCNMDKLNIETLDTITLNFTGRYVANGAVDAIVEEAKFDSSDYSITITCWVPVRAGEMEEYVFAFPASLQVQYVFPTPEDIASGRAGTGKGTPKNDNVSLPTNDPNIPPAAEQPFTGDPGTGGQINISKRPLSWGVDPSYLTDIANTIPEILSRLDASTIQPGSGTKPAGTTDYLYEIPPNTEEETPSASDDSLTSVFPGIIESVNGDGTYLVNIYPKGLDNDPEPITDVRLVQDMPEPEEGEDPESFSEGTGVLVTKVEFEDENGDFTTEYYMQPPVWQ